jgi:hypothetical protein
MKLFEDCMLQLSKYYESRKIYKLAYLNAMAFFERETQTETPWKVTTFPLLVEQCRLNWLIETFGGGGGRGRGRGRGPGMCFFV